jgi:hypothetical protein
MVDQYQKMLEEDFRIQKEMYIKLKDLQMLDLDERTIKKLLAEYGLNPKLARSLIKGEYTPINFSKPRFEKKIKIIENYLDKKSKETNSYIDLNKEYVFPKREFKDLKREYDNKEFFSETWDEESKQWVGGYYPERVEYLTDKKGNLVKDEKGNPIKDPNFSQRILQKVVPKIKESIKKLVNPLSGLISSNANAEPLPKTPMPDQKLVASMPQKNPMTGLTRTQSALLSPSEQVIARRT